MIAKPVLDRARLLVRLCLALLLASIAAPSLAQGIPAPHANHIHANLVADAPAGGKVTLALLMRPEAGWHGYWSNPGDAGFGLTLDWHLPQGATAGTPRFPVPQTLVISGLMNHVYEHDYAVLVPVTMPAGAGAVPVSVSAQWLACTLQICVPERAELQTTIRPGEADPRFTQWRAALPGPLDRPGSFALTPTSLRVAIPFPASARLSDPHLFVGTEGLVDYAAPQSFSRNGDVLVAEIARAKVAPSAVPQAVSAVLALGKDAGGIEVSARPGTVPSGGTPVGQAAGKSTSAWLAVLFALLGGLILNVMPCVFPILSLKALALARGGDEAHARAEGLAYTAGVVLACVALGATMLALRAAGEEVGWAFQLQQPGIVLALLLLAVAITANFAGLYELPGLSFERGGSRMGAFGTGLLAAFAATPCTGPFMAAAVGAALLLPWWTALGVFAALGLGLALPFLAIGFVPALRKLLPRPGKWMETFRRAMAVPMGLTALALVWLAWRIGGAQLASAAVVFAALIVWALARHGRAQRNGAGGGLVLAIPALVVVLGVLAAPRIAVPPSAVEAGLLNAKPYSEAALAEARAAGKPVFLYFTADWCLSCKVNEASSIERESTRDAFRKAGAVVLVGDWTRHDAAITRFLTSQGAAGVPLYLWYPVKGEPRQLPQVLTPDLLAGLPKS